MPRPDHRRRVPVYADVYAPLPGGLPDPDRDLWRHRNVWYQQIDLARAYAYAERLPVGSVVVVDTEDRLGRARRAAFWVASTDEEFGVRHVDPLTIEDCPDGMFPQVPHERPRPLRRTLGFDLRRRA